MLYDAIVIGGGPAGATSALALARRGWSVALIEKTAFPRRKVCGEFLSATNAVLLRDLGLEDALRPHMGPEVRRIGLFAGRQMVTEKTPRNSVSGRGWGFAVARETLDDLIVQAARAAGVDVLIPWRAVALAQRNDQHSCIIANGTTCCEIRAPVVILAHGSWDSGTLATQTRRPRQPQDLLAFKARFHNAALDRDLMPLLAFSGGYGGMVNSSDKSLSLTFCIRRDVLESLRKATKGNAGEIALNHLKAHCAGAESVLRTADLAIPILAAGPIAPGIRPRYADGLFRVGNLAGEAHPVVAEGISMAMQAGWLLARLLSEDGAAARKGAHLDTIGHAYAARWLRSFAPRIYAASLFAHVAMQPTITTRLVPLFAGFPALLAQAAALSGKT